jgi:hypothetical protein
VVSPTTSAARRGEREHLLLLRVGGEGVEAALEGEARGHEGLLEERRRIGVAGAVPDRAARGRQILDPCRVHRLDVLLLFGGRRLDALQAAAKRDVREGEVSARGVASSEQQAAGRGDDLLGAVAQVLDAREVVGVAAGEGVFLGDRGLERRDGDRAGDEGRTDDGREPDRQLPADAHGAPGETRCAEVTVPVRHFMGSWSATAWPHPRGPEDGCGALPQRRACCGALRRPRTGAERLSPRAAEPRGWRAV